MRLKRETQGAFCVLNANVKSQMRKSMKINVICTVRTCNLHLVSYFNNTFLVRDARVSYIDLYSVEYNRIYFQFSCRKKHEIIYMVSLHNEKFI